MIESARKVICLSISEKIGSVQPIRVCGFDQVHTLITELEPEDEKLAAFRKAGVNVI
jgi:DeoR/GlpR family transcriptional regulator of sugar metabolism